MAKGIFQRAGRVAVGVHPGRPASEAGQVPDGFGRVIGSGVVIGEPVVDLLQPAGVQGLQGLARCGVQRPPAALKQRRIGDVLGERMFEDEPRLLAGLLVDELEVLQCPQLLRQVSRLRPECREHPQGHLAPHHGRGLQQLAWCLVQPVDPGHQHILDGVGNKAGTVGCAAVENRAGQLLQEEWVAFPAFQDHPCELMGNLVLPQD